MARKEQITYTYTDDLTGEELTEDEVSTISFSYGGIDYSIDLSSKNAKKLDDFLAPYQDAATRVRKSGAAKAAAPGKKKKELGPVRTWAAENGYDINAKGRVPKAVLDAYDAAHGYKS